MSRHKRSPQRSSSTQIDRVARPLRTRNSWATHLLHLSASIALGGTVWVVYSRAADAPFIFDDIGSVVRNGSIVKLWPLVSSTNQPGPLNPRKGISTAGRPLVNLTFAIDYSLCQLDPRCYRVFNIVVHVCSAVLLGAIVGRTLRLPYFNARFGIASEPLSWIVAVLWALHPLQTETVVYITQRTELLVGFFYLGTMYCSLRYLTAASRAARNVWLVLAAMACILGMASKEVMVSAPVMVLLFERTFLRRTFREAAQNSWPLYMAFLFGYGLLLYLNIDGPRTSSAGFHSDVPAIYWWLTQTKVLVLYLKLAIWPWPLLIHYEMPYLTSVADAWRWLLPVILLAAATMILLWRRAAIGFLGAWIFAILSPTLLVPIITEVAAERRMYLPLAALVTAAVAGGFVLIDWLRISKVGLSVWRNSALSSIALVTVTAIAIAITYSIIDAHRLADYRDEVALWSETLAYEPGDYLVHNNLGLAWFNAGDTQKAMDHYREAARLNPDDAEAYNNMGNAFVAQNKLQAAIEFYLRAIAVASDYADAHNNLGNAFSQTGQIQKAIKQYQAALRLDPGLAVTHHNLGNLLAQTGRLHEAIEQYQQALQLNDQIAMSHNNLALVLVEVGQIADAIEHYSQAIALNPGFSDTHNNLGRALLSMRQPEQAFEQFVYAVRLRPDYSDAWGNLINTLPTLERTSQSINSANEAVGIAKLHGQDVAVKHIEVWLNSGRSLSPVTPDSH
jgi:protein O-mannosyl-transferase